MATSLTGSQIQQAYQALFGNAMAGNNQQYFVPSTNISAAMQPYTALTTPQGGQITLSQLMAQAGQGGGGTPASASSYGAPANNFGAAPTITYGTPGSGSGSGSGIPSLQPGQLPEQAALAQMAKIDPQTEALRSALSSSYLSPLQQAGAPTADQFKSYLNMYGQIDPTGLAARQALGNQLTSQAQLGSQLDPVTARQVEQQTRMAQAARGNVYGTPQLTEEAMTTGEAGLALQQQRQQALQSYLGSGQTTGDVALNLYNQQQNQLRASQGAALGYLGSGSTPYQTGSSYLQLANQNAANAAQGGPQYNPQSLGQQYSGTSQQFPQYGLDIGAQSQNMMGAMNYGRSIGANQPNQTGQLISGVGSALGSVLGGASKL